MVISFRREEAKLRYGIFFGCLIASVAYAHKPFFSEGGYGSPDSAWPIDNLDTSIVMYHPVQCDEQQLWLTFDGDVGAELFFQLGVPVIDELRNYRPSIAILAPGLPSPDQTLPFALPDGLGALVFHAADTAQPQSFFEPFTQTESWIWVEQIETLRDAGQGYLVAWVPDGIIGKLWVAVGTVEDFSDATAEDFISWRPKTRGFHEVDGQDSVDSAAMQACPVTSPNHSQGLYGCSAIPRRDETDFSLWPLLTLCLAGLARRRQIRSQRKIVRLW